MAPTRSSSPVPAESLLKSGEFASLCRTTKDTLRHYRAIGLLEPAQVGANGYALYSPLQISDFLLIAALQNAGSSLEEIGRLLASPDDAALDRLMEERIRALKDERAQLLAQQRFLEGTLERKRALDAWKELARGEHRDWRIVHLDEQPLLEIDASPLFAPGIDPASERMLQEKILENGMGSLHDGTAGQLQAGIRVGLEAVRAGAPETDLHLCIPLGAAQRRRTNAVRPAGTYFQTLRADTLDNLLAHEERLFDAYGGLLANVERRGLTPLGDVYEQELSLYLGDTSAQAYTELSVRVDDAALEANSLAVEKHG